MLRIIFILALFFPLAGNGQSMVSELIQSYSLKTSEESITAKIDQHIAQLEKQRLKKSEIEFLEFAFEQTHRKFLKSYIPYSQFNEVMETGRFDCLSATALFSIVFDRLAIEYQINETNYHIFLLVNTMEGDVLIETTDRFNGFVYQTEKIQARMETYRKNEIAAFNKNFYEYQANIFQEVSPTHLVGLLYFNQAVRLYNERDLLACSKKLDDAIARYENPRTDELAVILIHSIRASNLSQEEKSAITTRYQKYIQKARPVLASR